MKTKLFGILFVFLIMVLFGGVFTSCSKKDEPVASEKKWITVYQNITLGNQHNITNGHFLKLKTGESVKLESVFAQQEYMALMIFTDYGINNTYLTFPANAADAATFKDELKTNRLFVQPSAGLNYWNTAKMTNGMVYQAPIMTANDFNNIIASKDWAVFDLNFKKNNGDEEKLSYKLAYELEPQGGDIFLLQFNGLVRAILYVKSYVKKADNSTALTFDIIIESRASYTQFDMAKNLQP